MRVAIAGAGSVGTAIARDLHASGHDVLVLEQDPELVERRRHELDVTWVAADACEVSSLDAAGLATVDVVVAATGDDEDNLVISLLAKQEFAVPRVVARVNHSEEPVAVQRELGRGRLGLDPPAADGPGRGGRLGRLAGPAAPVPGGLGPPGGDHPGRRLAGGRRWPSPTSASPATPRWWPWCASDRLVVPRGDTVLQAGDEVLVLVTADAEPAVQALFIGDVSARGARWHRASGGPRRHVAWARERRRSSTSTRRSSPRPRSPPSAARSAAAG